MSAELNRTPFDVAEAESEIIAGYHTEYSGIKFALIQAAEFGGALFVSGLIATLFLAGWAGPVADWLGWLWFLIKTFIGIFLFVWIRSTFPRLRLDQIMAVCWKFLMPLSFINLAVVTLEVYFLAVRDSSNLSTAELVDNDGDQHSGCGGVDIAVRAHHPAESTVIARGRRRQRRRQCAAFRRLKWANAGEETRCTVWRWRKGCW